MNLADLSIKRPVFITALVILMLVSGLIFMNRLPVDLFPNVTFPIVFVTVPYRGAGPAEIETQVARPLEDEMSTIAGVKRLSANASEGVGTIVIEFTMETDLKAAESRVRDAITVARRKLPKEIDEPIIRRLDPSDQPVLLLGLNADLPPGELYDLANEEIRPRLEQVDKVGLVEIIGGRKREVQVKLDREKLKAHELSAMAITNRIAASGENIPIGKQTGEKTETSFRAVAQYKNIQEIGSVVLNFFGNDRPVTVSDVGTVVDGLRDETSRTYINGDTAISIFAFRQSGANTVAVVDALLKRVGEINKSLEGRKGKPEIKVIRDSSLWIRANLTDVKESILIGITLAVIVVFLFLANGRSTIITALALPNSLIGAFILMAMAGFSINIMTLLALSLTVGLLIDDAIVVRENIFRHLEMGKSAMRAAIEGTGEVRLAVIATTFAVVAVFGPVGFLQGMVGQFFREFGLTVLFAMLISLFDALTIAPMLSAYFAGRSEKSHSWLQRKVLDPFDRFQSRLESKYAALVAWVVVHPIKTLVATTIVFFLSVGTTVFVPKTFMPQQDAGEFAVGLSLPPGTSLPGMATAALEVDKVIRGNPEVLVTALTVGGRDGDPSVAEFYVRLVPFAERRPITTTAIKERLREQLKPFSAMSPNVKDYDFMGGGMRPFVVVLKSPNQQDLEKYGQQLLDKLKAYPKLHDVEISFRAGKPEFQAQIDQAKAERLGVSSAGVGLELRNLIDGAVAGKFREMGREYDVRVRLKDDQRDLKEGFGRTFVPNINYSLVPLKNISTPFETTGPNKITRQDRSRYVQLMADLAPGAGMGEIMSDIAKILKDDLKIPDDMSYRYVGQAENFQELGASMVMAMALGTALVYLVLASLYESFVVPLTIMMAMPLAAAGSFVALAIARQSLNIFSWIGMILLFGVASKNSILLVDFANQKVSEGWERSRAIIEAGRVRLRPILMTTMALIAGTIPIALGLNEASRQRVSMGVAIIGGLVSSTLLTLVVIPAVYEFIDRFRVWSRNLLASVFMAKDSESAPHSSKEVDRQERKNEVSAPHS